MNAAEPSPLLGGLSPRQFMSRYWQKKPLLVRGAIPGFAPLLSRAELFALAARDEVESRLVVRSGGDWTLRRGPISRRGLPPLAQRGWTLLVQGADLHHPAAHELLGQFRFVPQARLDDLMISYASDGGGVGPHYDSYDVFLLQAQGRRHWRIGRQKDLTLRTGVPLKILAHFEPEAHYVLEPGDLLYLPPRYAHDGAAQGECQTYSIGFRSPGRGELARELLQRLSDHAAERTGDAVYRDPAQPATSAPGAVPPPLQHFARAALHAALKDPLALHRALGEYLTEPKASVWFEAGGSAAALRGAVLDRRTRMMYDRHHIYINGESHSASGGDAALLRRLADQRSLGRLELAGSSKAAKSLLASWCEAGWIHAMEAKR
ncbi:MAG TPA: cupin domain-containing protein [Ramlibacter sp.]|nr:cupin domain-containing protein [Ramlibacter sp.]